MSNRLLTSNEVGAMLLEKVEEFRKQHGDKETKIALAYWQGMLGRYPQKTVKRWISEIEAED